VAATKRVGTVTAASLNVRDAPKGKKLGALSEGKEVEVVGEQGGWLQIKFGEATGWVSAKYIESRGPGSPHRPAKGVAKRAYDANASRVQGMEKAGTHDGELTAFMAHWEKHRARYEAVAAEVDLPAPLVAALHWRESSGNFATYLHQGDPLGKAAVHVPKDIPVFHKWEPAAVHALKMKGSVQRQLALNGKTKELAAIATYAEMYNGLGYHNKGKASPYVYAGTNKYSKGKYTSDGKYDANVKDQQVGVMAMMQAVEAADAAKAES
jgi:lysozyme family protein